VVKLLGKCTLEKGFQEALNSYKCTFIIVYIGSHLPCSAAEAVPSGSVPLVPALKLGILLVMECTKVQFPLDYTSKNGPSKLNKRIAASLSQNGKSRDISVFPPKGTLCPRWGYSTFLSHNI